MEEGEGCARGGVSARDLDAGTGEEVRVGWDSGKLVLYKMHWAGVGVKVTCNAASVVANDQLCGQTMHRIIISDASKVLLRFLTIYIDWFITSTKGPPMLVILASKCDEFWPQTPPCTSTLYSKKWTRRARPNPSQITRAMPKTNADSAALLVV